MQPMLESKANVQSDLQIPGHLGFELQYLTSRDTVVRTIIIRQVQD